MNNLKLSTTNKSIRHELKTPLAVISGYAQLLKQKLKDPKEEKWAEEIVNEVSKLNDMINELLRD
jgi:two-component system sensor histidine kinase VanS